MQPGSKGVRHTTITKMQQLVPAALEVQQGARSTMGLVQLHQLPPHMQQPPAHLRPLAPHHPHRPSCDTNFNKLPVPSLPAQHLSSPPPLPKRMRATTRAQQQGQGQYAMAVRPRTQDLQLVPHHQRPAPRHHTCPLGPTSASGAAWRRQLWWDQAVTGRPTGNPAVLQRSQRLVVQAPASMLTRVAMVGAQPSTRPLAHPPQSQRQLPATRSTSG